MLEVVWSVLKSGPKFLIRSGIAILSLRSPLMAFKQPQRSGITGTDSLVRIPDPRNGRTGSTNGSLPQFLKGCVAMSRGHSAIFSSASLTTCRGASDSQRFTALKSLTPLITVRRSPWNWCRNNGVWPCYLRPIVCGRPTESRAVNPSTRLR